MRGAPKTFGKTGMKLHTKRTLKKTGDTSTDLTASKLRSDKLPPTRKIFLSKMAVLDFKTAEVHEKCVGRV